MIDIIKFNPILLTLDILGKINAFVQVGAHDGEMFDPLRHFILKDNWNGILIEPQEDFFNKCIQGYKHLNNLIFVNAAVYKRREKIILYKAQKAGDYSHTGWASINLKRFQNTIYQEQYIKETVQGIPLMDIIRDNNYKRVDLLQIDTEGYDADIIFMFDFEEYHPRLIQYEHIHLSEEKRLAVKNRICQYGYNLFEKKNDTFALHKNQISIQFISLYIIVRIYQSLSSRIQNILRKRILAK